MVSVFFDLSISWLYSAYMLQALPDNVQEMLKLADCTLLKLQGRCGWAVWRGARTVHVGTLDDTATFQDFANAVVWILSDEGNKPSA